MSSEAPDGKQGRIIILGRLGGPFGLAGWLHVNSYSDPPENILTYPSWQVERGGQWTEVQVETGRPAHKDILVKLAGIESPEQAKTWSGARVGVPREQLPQLTKGEYYLNDLEGVDVLTGSGERLGRLERFESFPAHPIMVVQGEKEHLVPFVKERILRVDLTARQIVVDWSADW